MKHVKLTQSASQIDVSFLYVCPLTDDKFRHNIAKVCCRSTRLRLVDLQHFDNVMTKFSICLLQTEKRKTLKACPKVSDRFSQK